MTSSSAADIRVLSGGAPQDVLAVLTPAFEKQTGHSVSCAFAVISALRQRLDAGEKADIVLLPVPVIEAYVTSGQLRADGWAALGRVGIVAIVKQGAPAPDISTVQRFREALLAARAVVHATPSATPSGAHMAKVIKQLGIADAMRSKVLHRPALEGGVEAVANGEADLGIYPASEIARVKGVATVGPLPAELQLDLLYGAAVTADSTAPVPALALVRFLSDPANRTHWRSAGFEPPNG